MRCTKREVTVGAPAILAARAEDHFRGAERLREVVRGKADAALGRIEAEVAAHRPAQPGIAARLGRPGALVEAAEHDAIDALQARFQRAEDAHAHVRRFRPPHHAVADAGVEQLGIVAFGDRKAGGGRALGELFEGAGERDAVMAGEGGDLAGGILAERGDDVAVARGQRRQRMRAGFSVSSGASAAPSRAIKSAATSNSSSAISQRGSLR